MTINSHIRVNGSYKQWIPCNYTMVNLSSLKLKTKKKLHITQLECDGENNGEQVNFTLVCQTQNFVRKIMLIDEITKSDFIKLIKCNIENKEVDLHEIYTILANFSLWEIMEELLKDYKVTKISHNMHRYNVLHKALLPSWLWNYETEPKKMPKNLRRKYHDITNTVKLLLRNNLCPSILEMTPEIKTGVKSGNENALIIITKTIPFEVIKDVFNEIYTELTHPELEERYEIDVKYVCDKYFNKRENITINDLQQNEILWLVTLSEEKFAKYFVKYCVDEKIINCINLLLIVIEKQPIKDGIFDCYFEKIKWNNSKIINLLNGLIIELKTNKIAK